MATCFFIGHQDAPDSLLPQLSAEIERHITECGVSDFVMGGYGRFDALAVTIAIKYKSDCSPVTWSHSKNLRKSNRRCGQLGGISEPLKRPEVKSKSESIIRRRIFPGWPAKRNGKA